MKPFSIEQIPVPAKNSEADIFERISKHSIEFDNHTGRTRNYLPEEVQKIWQVREWKIGDSSIRAIGVMHVPETFLEFREEIEKAVQECDVVVNEFAPEALGLYDQSSAPRLKTIPSKINGSYNIEELRQAYMKYERSYNIGCFQHEIELLAAKYRKDMAICDITLSKDAEELLQDKYLYVHAAEEIKEREARMKKAGLYTGAAALSLTGLYNFIQNLGKKPDSDLMTRRNFLKSGLVAGAGIALAGLAPKLAETPPKTALQKEETRKKNLDKDDQLQILRNPKIAEGLRQLAEKGYKKIVVIYGANHMKKIEEYLLNPEKGTRLLADNQGLIDQENPDVFRIYRLAPGENKSEKFVASRDLVWKRLRDTSQ